jgi:multiple sugar transport system permease protein
MSVSSVPSNPISSRPARKGSVRRGPPTYVMVIVWFFALLWLVPIVGALVTSVRTFDDLNIHGFWTIPNQLTLDNFSRAWNQAHISRYLGNSFKITIPALAITMLFSSMCAYALVRFKFLLNRPIYMMFVAGLMLPFQIMLLPVFMLANKAHFLPALSLNPLQLQLTTTYDTFWALILFHSAFQMGFSTFVLRNFMKTVPASLFESAVIDGATEWTIFRRIALPLLLPGLAALATLEFTWIFNDYLWAVVLIQNDNLKPITTGLANLRGQYVSDWPLLVAGSMIATVPTLLVFFGLQRYFIDGLTVGATKG